MTTVRELVTRIAFDVDQAKIDKVNKSVNTLKNRLNKVSDFAFSAGKSLTMFATVPIAALGGFLIKAASDAEETASKFSVVFQDVSNEAQEVARNLEMNYGLSSTASKQLLSDTGDLLTGFGFTGKAALDVSKQVNELAVDLASFTNYAGGAAGASRALTKGLLGERESMKLLGISINEEDLKAKMLELTKQGLTFETERQAKAYATLLLAQKQSKNAIGDFARTQDSFANSMRILKARIDNTAISLGNLILPDATKFVRTLIGLVDKFNGLSDGTKQTILTILGVIAVLGPLLLTIALLSKGIVYMITLWQAFAKVIIFIRALSFSSILLTIVTALKSLTWASIAAQLSFLLIPIAIGLVIYILYKLIDVWGKFSLLDISFLDFIIEGLKGISIWLANVWDGIMDFFGLGDQKMKNTLTTEEILRSNDQREPLTPISSIMSDEVSANQNALRMANLRDSGTFNELMQPRANNITPIPQGALSTNNNVNVKSDIIVNVPPGTSQQQADFLKQAARQSFSQEYERELQTVLYNNTQME